MSSKTSAGNPARKLFFGLFVFPLVIAVGMALLLCTVVFLTSEPESPETLIAAVKSGAPSKRWQKAFELSNELNRPGALLRDEGVMNEIIHILAQPLQYDARTRSYMALALAHFKEPRVGPEERQGAVKALRQSLRDSEPAVRIHGAWALGLMEAHEAARDLLPLLKSEDAAERKTAAYVVGVLGEEEEIAALKPLLDDPVADVKWNAALGLARLGDGSGREILVRMLDRGLLSEFSLKGEELDRVMINAAKGLALVGNAEAAQVLKKIAGSDESLKVREAALSALKVFDARQVRP